MDRCPNWEACGFFKKYQATKDLACKGFVLQYCEGLKQGDCKRKLYKKEHNAAPPDDMMPNGQNIA